MANLCVLSRCGQPLYISCLSQQTLRQCWRRNASTQPAQAAEATWPDLVDVEPISGLTAPQVDESVKRSYKPWKRQARSKRQLPAARYQYHPPKYRRGPLHAIQSPPSSDPIARDFVPGPFNLPRLRETYHSTIAPDLLTLTYNHVPPGTPKVEKADRQRRWEGDSPYFANRPKRSPRGHDRLPLVERDINFTNIPEIKSVAVATYQPLGVKNTDYLIAARAALMAITGTMPDMTKAGGGAAAWGVARGRTVGAKATLYGNEAYEFLDRVVHIVFPRIKDWPGLPRDAGDGSGNVGWGFTSAQLQLFPEIEMNYNIYPTKMIPGCRIFINTTATSDRQARLLLTALGIPFDGSK